MSLKVKILGLIAFLVVDAVLFYFIRERNLSHLADDPKTPAPTTASATPAPTFGGPVTMTASHNGAVFLVHRGSCAKKERPLVQVSSGGGARFR